MFKRATRISHKVLLRGVGECGLQRMRLLQLLLRFAGVQLGRAGIGAGIGGNQQALAGTEGAEGLGRQFGAVAVAVLARIVGLA